MIRTFYSDGGLNAETYDMRTFGFPGEIDFWIARARESGGPVLELACGTGRVSWPIARAGIDIVGIDLAPAMLAEAERKRAAETPGVAARVRFVRADRALSSSTNNSRSRSFRSVLFKRCSASISNVRR